MGEIDQKRKIWMTCRETGQRLIEKALAFQEERKPEAFQMTEPVRVEYVAGARHLQRGRYCPSIVRDLYLSNASRGSILRRITAKTKYSHRYFCGQEGKMLMAETDASVSGRKLTEYFLYEGNAVLGFTFDDGGAFLNLSEEDYREGKLQSYFFASCFIDRKSHMDFGILQTVYEAYTHDASGFSEVAIYNVSPCIEDPDGDSEINDLISSYRYRFVREKGLLIGGQPVDSAGILYYSVPKNAMTGEPIR